MLHKKYPVVQNVSGIRCNIGISIRDRTGDEKSGPGEQA
jgi:hypothetical protein